MKILKTYTAGAVMLAAALFISQAALAAKSECPKKMASIDGAFCMDIYEYPNKQGEKPYGGITWEQAGEMCTKEGKRLCSFQEWSKACSGPKGYKYPYGNEYKAEACHDSSDKSSKHYTSGSFDKCKSGYGVYDISGSQWEWTSDTYSGGEYRGLQGGAGNSAAADLVCTEPIMEKPDWKNEYAGFRCCADIAGAPKVSETKKEQPKKQEKAAGEKQAAAPLPRIAALALHPSPSTPGGPYFSAEYDDPGDIVNIDSTGSNLKASGMALTAGWKFENASFEYTRLSLDVDWADPFTTTGSKTVNADIFTAAIYFNPGLNLPVWRGGFIAGVRRFDGGDSDITEGFVNKEFSYAKFTLIPGLNYLDGDSGSNLGLTFEGRYSFTPQIGFIAKYNSEDFYKAILNDAIVTETPMAASVSCIDCNNDSWAAGLTYTLTSGRGGLFFMYNDIGDLDMPLGGASFRF